MIIDFKDGGECGEAVLLEHGEKITDMVERSPFIDGLFMQLHLQTKAGFGTGFICVGQKGHSG
jgi:hypothetical protein